MGRITGYVLDAVRRPREQLTRGQHQLRYAWELARHCIRQLQRHRAEGMAAELTYRTIFSLIPVVVLGLVMFRVVGGLEDVQEKVENELYSFFGVPEIPTEYLQPDEIASDDIVGEELAEVDLAQEQLVLASPAGHGDVDNASVDTAEDDTAKDDTGPDAVVTGERSLFETASGETAQDGADGTSKSDPTAGESVAGLEAQAEADQAEAARRATRASIRRTLHDATSKVSSIDFASIGVFGLLLFVYAAVALADSTEYLFNRIFDAPKHRPIHIRLAIHWSIITLGSGLLAMSLYMSGRFVDWAGTIGADTTLQLILTRLLSIAASWVLLFLLYALMPNTNVSPRAAAIGSFVGSLLWEAAKFGFQIYVITAVPYSAIYGSLGLIPLFLFWIYVTWLIVLFGLILTYTLQTLRGRRLRRDWANDGDLLQGDPDWMLPVMTEVAHAFGDGRSIDHQELADKLGLSGRVVQEMASKLLDSELLRRVSTGAGEENSLTLSRPAEKILVSEILEIAHRSRPTSSHPAWKTLASLKHAEREAAKDKSLADIADLNGDS